MRIAFLAASLALALAACRSEPVEHDVYADLPRRSLAEARAALPEPSVDGAFVFDGTVYRGILRPFLADAAGRARIAVEAGTYDGRPAWFVLQETDEERSPSPGAPRTVRPQPRTTRPVRRTAWLSRELFVLRSDLVDGDDFHETSVAQGAGAVVTTTRDGTTEVTSMTQPLDGLATLAGALLFFRMCPSERAAYGEPPLCPCVLRVVQDEWLTCSIPTKGATALITLRGPERTPLMIDRSADDAGCIVARPPATK